MAPPAGSGRDPVAGSSSSNDSSASSSDMGTCPGSDRSREISSISVPLRSAPAAPTSADLPATSRSSASVPPLPGTLDMVQQTQLILPPGTLDASQHRSAQLAGQSLLPVPLANSSHSGHANASVIQETFCNLRQDFVDR